MKFFLFLVSTFIFSISAQANGGAYTCKKTSSGVCAVSVKTGQCTHEWSNDDSGNPMFHCQKFTGQKVSNFNKANYFCRNHGDYVCAASKITNQCTHSWGQDDHNDPMWSCRKFLGLETSSFNKSNFQCKKTATGACAQSKVTGQCTHAWSSDDHHDPMWACNKWLKN